MKLRAARTNPIKKNKQITVYYFILLHTECYRWIRSSCNINWHRRRFAHFLLVRSTFITNLTASYSCFLLAHATTDVSPFFLGFYRQRFFARIVGQLNVVTLTRTRRTTGKWNYSHGGTKSVHEQNSIARLTILNSTPEVSLVVSCNNRTSQCVDHRRRKQSVRTTFQNPLRSVVSQLKHFERGKGGGETQKY